MLKRSALLGAVTLYFCSFVNFDHVIARHNLTRDVASDPDYLCQLSEGALPAMQRHGRVEPERLCDMPPRVFQPADWREWGFRNWRVRRSLAAMRSVETEGR